MKLLTYTSRLQMLYFLVLFGIFSILFYLVLSWNVLQNVDEVLNNRKVNLLAYLEENPEAPFKEDNPLDDFTFFPVEKKVFQESYESYTDTLIYEPVDDEFDEYRKLTAYVKLHNNNYRLEIIKPHLEAGEMIGTIAITLGSLFMGLALSFYLTQRIISKKIWKSFFEMLERLRLLRFDKEKMPELPSTNIDEFRMLNEAVNELTRKNKEVFENQKQFIEDASHELQTPLSIIQSKLEALVSRSTLTAEQAAIVDSIIGSAQRLKKLNKTLLLLAKIENSQFLMTDEVNVNEIIGRSLEYYDEQKEILNIKMKINIRNRVVTSGNKVLTEILIQNLLKNAFLHNVEDGMVSIKLDKEQLIVTNTGNQKSISQKKLFQRFYKCSNNPESWGLGLSIAYKIADKSNWKLKYNYDGDQHIFTIYF